MNTYVINLDRSPERLEFMMRQLQELDLPAQRVPAVDGATITLPDKRVDPVAFNRRHHAALRPGEIGCYLSHLKALRTFLASNSLTAMILEDDAWLDDDLPHVLEQLAAMPYAWDMVKLYATHPGGKVTRARLANHRLVSLAFRHGASAAYVVNRHAAISLVGGLLPMTVPFDHEFDRAWKYDLKLRAVMPFPVQRARFASTIGAKPPQHKPWYRQGGMLAFRGWNDIARVVHELRG